MIINCVAQLWQSGSGSDHTPAVQLLINSYLVKHLEAAQPGDLLYVVVSSPATVTLITAKLLFDHDSLLNNLLVICYLIFCFKALSEGLQTLFYGNTFTFQCNNTYNQ